MTTMAREISNYDDVIDSRDVIERIAELEYAEEHADCDGCGKGITEDDAAELAALRALQDEAQSTPDWRYGETLIRDDYFTEYAQQLAEECDMVSEADRWPMTCIDWEEAARQLQVDYFTVDFDGVTYWVRA